GISVFCVSERRDSAGDARLVIQCGSRDSLPVSAGSSDDGDIMSIHPRMRATKPGRLLSWESFVSGSDELCGAAETCSVSCTVAAASTGAATSAATDGTSSTAEDASGDAASSVELTACWLSDSSSVVSSQFVAGSEFAACGSATTAFTAGTSLASADVAACSGALSCDSSSGRTCFGGTSRSEGNVIGSKFLP